MIAPPPRKLTEEEFMALPDDGRKYELVNGEAKEVPTGVLHSRITIRLIMLLVGVAARLGDIFESGIGFRLPNGNVRSPDVSFVRRERFPAGEAPAGFVDGAPDLAIEVISPSESSADMAAKVVEYLDAGTWQVWQVFPESRRVVVYRSLDDVRTYTVGEGIDAGEVLPGLTVQVADVFSAESAPSS